MLVAKSTFSSLLALLSPSAAVSPAASVELLTKWLSRLQTPVGDIIKVKSIYYFAAQAPLLLKEALPNITVERQRFIYEPDCRNFRS